MECALVYRQRQIWRQWYALLGFISQLDNSRAVRRCAAANYRRWRQSGVMTSPLSRIAYRKADANPAEILVEKEWLVTNGLGGYSAGTLAGVITRGFHGYLIAALPTPLGRVMMLNDLLEKIET